MKNTFIILLTALVCTVLNGCRTVHVQGPEIPAPAVKPKIAEAKKTLKSKAPTELPAVLGGIVQSDSWVIYKDKQQEEFSGNVSYDNGTYQFRADYALSERAKNRFTARGNVYLKQNDPQGSSYEAYAHYARYNYKTQQGELKSSAQKQIKLIYTDEKKQTGTAWTDKATFDLAQKIFTLEGNVRVERPTPAGKEILTAQKVTFKQSVNYAILEGDAKITDGLRTLDAQTIVYDGNKNYSYAYGARPMAYGKNEENTFAIIADQISADNEGKKIVLDGKVQGWVVAPKLNEADINSKF